MIPLKPSSPYPKFYKQICKQLNVSFNPHIKAGIGETEFTLRVDLLSSVDVQPIFLFIQSCKFKSIFLLGGTTTTVQTKLNKSTLQFGPQKYFSMTQDFLNLFKLCCQVIAKSLEILQFSIRDIRLSVDAVHSLSSLIQASSSLKELQLTNCSINTQQFSILVNAITHNSALIALDFSRNFLTDACGILLQRILEEHRSRRDRLEWVYRSRGESPEEDVALSGICELNLSYNRLESLFVKDLEYFLKNDRWIRSLNLRGNFIDEQGIMILNEVLDRNHALVSLDIRDNPGYSKDLSSTIYGKLVRNMKNVKEQNSLLANVSAIPKQGNSSASASYQQDVESPMISFGDRILEQNLTKYNSNSSKKGDFTNKKQNQQQQQMKQMIDEVGSSEQDQQCLECQKYQGQLRRANQIISQLQQENQALRGKQRGANEQKQHYSFQLHSTSNVLNVLWQNEQLLQSQSQQAIGEQDDVIHKIELMMSELTRMMDSIENPNSATNNNVTGPLSVTLLGQNNNTHVI